MTVGIQAALECLAAVSRPAPERRQANRVAILFLTRHNRTNHHGTRPQTTGPDDMLARSNAFADEHRIRALAETLEMSVDEVNCAFAAYLPRDTVEASMVGQILILEHNLHQATRAAAAASLTPLQADRLRRTVCTINRQLERAAIRLDKRQNQPTGLLPQQYWRETPIAAIGPYEDAAPVTPIEAGIVPTDSPPAKPAPSRAALLTRRHHPDNPLHAGDALYQLARMRISPDDDLDQLRAVAVQDAARSNAHQSPRGASRDHLAA